MGAENHIPTSGRAVLALFQALSLAVVLALQGVAAGDAMAQRHRDREERAGSPAECGISDERSEDRLESEEAERESPSDESSCPGSEDVVSDEDSVRDQGVESADDQVEPEHASDDEAETEHGEEAEGHDQAEPEEAESESAGPAESGEAEPDDAGIETGELEAEGEPEPATAAGEQLPVAVEGEETIGAGPTDAAGEADSTHPVVWPTAYAGPGGSSGGSKQDEPQDPGRADRDGKSPSKDAAASPATAEKATSAIASVPAADPAYDLDGVFSSATLLDALPPPRELRARNRVAEVAPFIIAGPASWTDTWGAPRFGPGSLIRSHEGQDVFCRYGDPVLVSESGHLELDNGGLGGKVARVRRDDGSYWYYAHLSAWNSAFSTDDLVSPGDVIGYCGNSGNAAGTPPHVHFGLYNAGGRAVDPMPFLVRWLREAEQGLEPPTPNGRGDSTPAPNKRDPRSTSAIHSILKADVFGDPGAAPPEPVEHRPTSVSGAPSKVPFALIAGSVLALVRGYGLLSLRRGREPELGLD